jgi:hypothetical protein
MRTTTLALLTLGLLCSRAYALDITTCDVTVPDKEIGVLQADLDCSESPANCHHITLGQRSTLDLNGHSIIASTDSISVACPLARRCVVLGPGDLSGGLGGIYAPKHLTVSNVTIHDTAFGVQSGSEGMLRINAVHVSGALQTGVSGGRIFADDVSASGGGGTGIRAFGPLRATNLVANDNGGAGIEAAAPYSISGLVANNNGQVPNREGAGLMAFNKGKLTNATLTGNSYSNPELGPLAVDIFASRPPKVFGVTCDHSLQFVTLSQAGAPWDICALD